MSIPEIHTNVLLSEYTSIGLGGPARFFVECTSPGELRSVLMKAKQDRLAVQILGGGSNIIFSDNGFDGIVIKVALRGLEFGKNIGEVTAGAGESWDAFVQHCIENDLAGIECLSGIPGLVGGTPIQNVGAYGQEVRETITRVEALDRESLEVQTFTNEECRFSYRNSTFKTESAGRYIITRVTFSLNKFGRVQVRYPELQKHIDGAVRLDSLTRGRQQLDAVRSAVLSLRGKKSMVIDPGDPNTRSVGSFFTNPLLTAREFAELQRRWESLEGTGSIPVFPSGSDMKVSAAWLVEHAGFAKGYRKGGAGISAHHALALINCGGTTVDLLSLARDIQENVFGKFGIRLEREPIVVA